jgi:hypothetical protein
VSEHHQRQQTVSSAKKNKKGLSPMNEILSQITFF